VTSKAPGAEDLLPGAADNAHPHRRYDPLGDRWVLVSPQRSQRPWQGEEESAAPEHPAYDPDCYLCPANPRVGGLSNPPYEGVYVFDNDFPALLDEQAADAHPAQSLFAQRSVSGRCRVICYSPRHNLTMGSMNLSQIGAVVDTWIDETRALRQRYEHVQIFENRGAAMGCSNAHPHGQIWALDYAPSEITTEDAQQAAYLQQHGRPLLLDYAEQELQREERIVCSNAHWVALVPWWATWPFEVLLLPRHPTGDLPLLNSAQRKDLAALLSQLLRTYDRLFAAPFPYSMGWHAAPTSVAGEHWQLHAHFYPPLLRSATVKKHMVGFEMLGEAQRDLTPEQAAAALRAVLCNPAGITTTTATQAHGS
jgi:UDPglucose--hexose-1-phosphate uridylyltransferase